MGVLWCVGCDRLPGGDAPSAETAPNTPTTPVATNTPEATAGATPTGTPAIATLVDNAAKASPQPVNVPTLPATLADLRVTLGGDEGEPVELEVTVDATVNEKIPDGSGLWVKARCRTGDDVFTETDTLSTVGSKELSAVAVGGSIVLQGDFELLRMDRTASRCALQFELAATYGGGPAISLGQGCWEAGTATLAPCAPTVDAVAASGLSSPIDFVDWSAKEGYSDSGFSIDYAVRVNQPLTDTQRIAIRLACEVDGKTLVESEESRWSWGPLPPEPGESIAGSTSFMSHVEGVTARPERCDVLFSLVDTDKSATPPAFTRAGCLRKMTIDEGPCDAARPAEPAPKPATSGSLALDRMAMTVDDHYRNPGQHTIELDFDVTVRDRIEADAEFDFLAECRVGSVAYRDTSSVTIGPDMRTGETLRMDETFFNSLPLDAKPDWCRFDFRATGGTTKATLATFCARGGKVRPGKC